MAPSIPTTAVSPDATSIDTKVWLITGCSSGFGRAIALAALKRGDLVIATARNVNALDELRHLGCEVLSLDVTASDEIVAGVIAKAQGLHGRIDILVNNAGYSANGAVEEACSSEIQDLFNTNVFGLLRVTRAVVPYMRARRFGTIANIGSVGGNLAVPMTGIYSASKYAVAGLTEGLRNEMAPFGIDVTVIEPDLFRTNILSALRMFKKTIDDYQEMKDHFQAAFSETVAMGDAGKGAQAIVEALTKTGRAAGKETLPFRLYLGGATRGVIEAMVARTKQELTEWAPFTDATAFLEETAVENKAT